MAFISIALMGGILGIAFIIFLVVCFLVYIGTLILQVILSRRKTPWVGLILPGITFSLMLFMVCAAESDLYYSLWWLVKGNIPTAIYLLIYFICRKRKKKSDSASQTIRGNGIKIGRG